MGRPEGVGPSLEREKTGDRDRGETGPERAAKRKRHVALQRVTRGASEREGEEDRERETEKRRQNKRGRAGRAESLKRAGVEAARAARVGSSGSLP